MKICKNHLGLTHCSEQYPLQQDEIEIGDSFFKEEPGAYHESGSRTFRTCYDRKTNTYVFQEGSIDLANGSVLKVTEGALTPPGGTPPGAGIILVMLVDKDITQKELIFNFGPHNCQFNPPAKVWFDWSDLDSPNVRLYYIDDNDNYIELEPDDIDSQSNTMLLNIDHFSRYVIVADSVSQRN